MQAARDLVTLAAELAAGMQDSKHYLDAGLAILRNVVDRNTSTVVCHRDRCVGVDDDVDRVATARERFVYRVVHNLVHEMVETLWPRGADIHTRALADGL